MRPCTHQTLIKPSRCSITGVVSVKKIIGKILNFNYAETTKKTGKKTTTRDYVTTNSKRKRTEKKSTHLLRSKLNRLTQVIDKEINRD